MITIPAHPKFKNQSKVVFQTGPYYASHGKSPAGRGSWIFCPTSKFNTPDYLDHCLSVSGLKTFTEARDIAAGYFAKKNIWDVTVCP